MSKLFYFTLLLQLIIPALAQAQWFGKSTALHPIPSESLVYSDYDSKRENPREGLCYDKYGYWNDNFWIINTGKYHHIMEYDHSKGYPILLNEYHYSESEDGIAKPKYEMQTLLNEAGIRTSVICQNYTVTLDNNGHVISYANGECYENMTWNDDQLASYEFYINSATQELHISINKIEILDKSKFNAYSTYYHDLFIYDGNPAKHQIPMNASGTYYEKNSQGIHESTFTIATEFERNGRNFTTTRKIGDEIQETIKVIFTDDFGSFTLHETHSDTDQYWETAYLYNEYGDYIQKIYREGNNQGVIEEETKELFEWKYDNGKPLEVTRYRNYKNGIPDYCTTEVFTAWHDPETSNDTYNSGDITILNGVLYNINGIFLRNLTTEEIQANDIHSLPKGIYLLRLNTNQGIQTRKIIITR